MPKLNCLIITVLCLPFGIAAAEKAEKKTPQKQPSSHGNAMAQPRVSIVRTLFPEFLHGNDATPATGQAPSAVGTPPSMKLKHANAKKGFLRPDLFFGKGAGNSE